MTVFEQKMKTMTEKIEEYLRTQVVGEGHLYEAIQYSLFSGGKRIRPAISMGVCEMLGGNIDDVLPFAAGIELIHTYSLIHDDMPCIDNSTVRRGMLANHAKYDEATALFSGDALQALAFDVMMRSPLDPSVILECIRTVAVASGPDGLVGGQMLDMQAPKDVNALQQMNVMKTGALIMASAWVGAVVGGADVSQYTSIGNYARNIGVAFQVSDDILDAGEADKNTYVTFLGIDQAKTYLNDLIQAAQMDIHTFGEKSYFLQDLANFIGSRTE